MAADRVGSGKGKLSPPDAKYWCILCRALLFGEAG